jgi:hypothetical protein
MFPLSNKSAIHPLCPRRPRRDVHSSTKYPPPKIFSRRQLARPGSVQEIQVSHDRLRIAQFRDGKFSGCVLFEQEDVEVLELAVELTKRAPGTKARNAGRAPTRPVGFVEIGAAPGIILLRRFGHDEDKVIGHVHIRGEEVDAFEKALSEFKSIASRDALSKESI